MSQSWPSTRVQCPRTRPRSFSKIHFLKVIQNPLGTRKLLPRLYRYKLFFFKKSTTIDMAKILSCYVPWLYGPGYQGTHSSGYFILHRAGARRRAAVWALNSPPRRNCMQISGIADDVVEVSSYWNPPQSQFTCHRWQYTGCGSMNRLSESLPGCSRANSAYIDEMSETGHV